jgi:hypothetical protein
MGGLADPTVGKYFPDMVVAKDDVRTTPLRQRPPGSALVVAERRPVFVVRVRPWWRCRRLRKRGVR